MKSFLIYPLSVLLITMQFGATGLNGQEPIAERIYVHHDRVVDVVYKGAFSKNDLTRARSFSILLKYDKLLDSLDEGNQLELVKSAIQDENVSIAKLGLEILAKSSVQNTDRYQILMELLSSKSKTLSNAAFAALSENRDVVLTQAIETIHNELTGAHPNEFLLIERLGPNAVAAVPVIVKSFHAKKAAAEKLLAASQDPNVVSSKQAPLAFDYLPHVYAIAEIGAAAHQAMPIALAAAEENGGANRTEYPVAGLICIEKLLAGLEILTDDEPLAGVPPETAQKYAKYVDSIFANYDANKDGILDQNEVAGLRRPPTGADRNKDGLVTKNEFILSLVGTSATRTSSSRSRQSASRRTTVRETVANSLQK